MSFGVSAVCRCGVKCKVRRQGALYTKKGNEDVLYTIMDSAEREITSMSGDGGMGG